VSHLGVSHVFTRMAFGLSDTNLGVSHVFTRMAFGLSDTKSFP
jgi:hypothetical protein